MVTLPALEGGRLFAGGGGGERALATTASGAPLRMAYLYFPNGVNVEKWKSGETLEPLAAHRADFNVLNGLAVKKATSGGDGGGDHARANAAFLTGVRPKKTAGADISLGQSVDQLAAMRMGNETRFRSLELSTDGVRKSGACDSGYSCAYQFNLSWQSPTLPMTPESNPRLLFERLFGVGTGKEVREARELRLAERKSVLDFVLEDAKRLQKTMGGTDRMKVEEYLTSVREIERRIEQAEKWELPDADGLVSPKGVPPRYEDHLRLMFDMLLLAFETDSTRVATFLLAHEGSNRSFPDIGVSEGHHNLSHHDQLPERLEKIAKIDRFYAEQFAYFLERAKAKKDLDGKSILENSMIVYGSAIQDGDQHEHTDLPVLFAGQAGGALETGRTVTLKGEVPMTNLYLRMLEEFGMPQERFGDSTGVLRGI